MNRWTMAYVPPNYIDIFNPGRAYSRRNLLIKHQRFKSKHFYTALQRQACCVCLLLIQQLLSWRNPKTQLYISTVRPTEKPISSSRRNVKTLAYRFGLDRNPKWPLSVVWQGPYCCSLADNKGHRIQKQIHVPCTSESRLVLVLPLIGWQCGTRYFEPIT